MVNIIETLAGKTLSEDFNRFVQYALNTGGDAKNCITAIYAGIENINDLTKNKLYAVIGRRIMKKKIAETSVKAIRSFSQKALIKLGLKAVPGVGYVSLAYNVSSWIWNTLEKERKGEYITLVDGIADFLVQHGPALESGDFDLSQVFDDKFMGKTFALPLSLGEVLQDDDPDQLDEPSSHTVKAGFRGSFDYSKFTDDKGDFAIDGRSYSYILGFDIQPKAFLDTGLSIMYNTTTADYESIDFIEIEGTYNTWLTSVHPFIKWKASDVLDLYASIGYGRINTKLTIDNVDNPVFRFMEGETRESEGTYTSYTAGIGYTVWQSEFTDLVLRLDGTTTSVLDAHSRQARFTTALSHDFAFDAGVLNTGVDLALLMSSADPSVMELAGRLGWTPQNSRFSGSGRVRVLLFGGERKEWGFGGSLSYRPTDNGEGLNVELRPSIGRTGRRFGLDDQDWLITDTADLSFGNATYTPRLNIGLGYGFRIGNGVLTPYTDVFLTQASTSYSGGLRYDFDHDGLELELETTHHSHSSGSSDNRIDLRLRSVF